MELGQLEAFVEAAQRGSISRAADALALSQPALTARLRQLERELGEPLLVRHVTGVTLTEAGRRFLPKVQHAFNVLRQGVDAVRQIHDASGGILRVGVNRQLAPAVLPAVMSRFSSDHPDVEVQVRTGMSAPIAALVSSGEVELALVVRPLRLPDLRSRRLYDDRLRFAAGPRHSLARRRNLTVADLGKAGLVVRESSTFVHSLTMEFFHRAEVVPRILAQVDDTETVRRIVAAGQGVCFLPRSATRREIESGALVELQLPGVTMPSRWIWVLTQRGSRLSGLGRAFLHAFAAELPGATVPPDEDPRPPHAPSRTRAGTRSPIAAS